MEKFKITAFLLIVTLVLSLAGCSFVDSLLGKEPQTEEIVQTESQTETVTEKPTEFVYSKDPADYVESARYEDYSNGYDIPRILIDSKDAKVANEDILGQYEPLFDIYGEADSSFRCTSISYDTHIANEVLTVIITAEYNESKDFYSIYTFDIKTGKRIGNKGVLDKLGMTLDEANEQLVKAVEIEYKDMFEDDYSDDEDYDFCLKRSMEEDNISEAVYFINNDGMLCALAQMKFVTDLKYYGVIVSV